MIVFGKKNLIELRFCKKFSNKVLIIYIVKWYIVESGDLEEIVELKDDAFWKKDGESCKKLQYIKSSKR